MTQQTNNDTRIFFLATVTTNNTKDADDIHTDMMQKTQEQQQRVHPTIFYDPLFVRCKQFQDITERLLPGDMDFERPGEREHLQILLQDYYKLVPPGPGLAWLLHSSPPSSSSSCSSTLSCRTSSADEQTLPTFFPFPQDVSITNLVTSSKNPKGSKECNKDIVSENTCPPSVPRFSLYNKPCVIGRLRIEVRRCIKAIALAHNGSNNH